MKINGMKKKRLLKKNNKSKKQILITSQTYNTAFRSRGLKEERNFQTDANLVLFVLD